MKYYFWILGCAMNYSDAERMATVLESLGYTKTGTEAEADLFIVIACSVRESAALSIYGKIRDLNQYRELNPNFKTILTGCVLAKDKKKLGRVFDVMIEMKDIEKLSELLQNVTPTPIITSRNKLGTHPIIPSVNKLGSWPPTRNDNEDESYLSITPHYESTFRAYVPISTGCDNFCSYCAVPYTKGREVSRPMREVVNEVKTLIENGYKEITLLGQNVNSYSSNDIAYEKFPLDSSHSGSDNNAFIELLTKLDSIPGDHRIYFYSNHPKDMTNELIDVLSELKHFPHYIHLPLQSGNNEILKEMNRHNTKEEYLSLVSRIRNAMPDVTLTTDIIVGYPGETPEQLADTADVMKIAEFDMAFIAQYSPRSGTVSAKKVDDVTKEEKKLREAILQKIVKKTVLEHNQKLVGTVQRVLIDEAKTPSSSQSFDSEVSSLLRLEERRLGSSIRYYGRTEGFKVVEIAISRHSEPRLDRLQFGQGTSESHQKKTLKQVQGDVDLVGQFVNVKIDKVSSWKLFGALTQ